MYRLHSKGAGTPTTSPYATKIHQGSPTPLGRLLTRWGAKAQLGHFARRTVVARVCGRIRIGLRSMPSFLCLLRDVCSRRGADPGGGGGASLYGPFLAGIGNGRTC